MILLENKQHWITLWQYDVDKCSESCSELTITIFKSKNQISCYLTWWPTWLGEKVTRICGLTLPSFNADLNHTIEIDAASYSINCVRVWHTNMLGTDDMHRCWIIFENCISSWGSFWSFTSLRFTLLQDIQWELFWKLSIDQTLLFYW